MRIKLQYYYHNDVYSFGFLTIDENKFKAQVIADPPRKEKIAGKTRFRAGHFQLQINKADTPLTIKHREAYNKTEQWFKYHIEVTGIPDFKGCYFHSGIDAAHTEGCVLLMYALNCSVETNQGNLSLKAVKDFYEIVYPLLEKGEQIFIDVIDEPF